MTECKRRNMIYYTIGGDVQYKQLLELSIESVLKNCQMKDTDIIVMCDKNYEEHVKGMNGVVDIMITPINDNNMVVSMRKCSIFSYDKIDRYDRVLYLDCDTVVKKDIVTNFLDKMKVEDKLHVYEERIGWKYHTDLFWGLEDYTEEQLHQFRFKQQNVFNCGHFAFFVNKTMETHFANVMDMIAAYKGRYFYEQSFMNKYFNTHFLTLASLTPIVYIPKKSDNKVPSNAHIIHVADVTKSYMFKLELMKKYYFHM